MDAGGPTEVARTQRRRPSRQVMQPSDQANKDLPEMVSDLRAYLRSTQKRPDVVRSFFHERHVRYAA